MNINNKKTLENLYKKEDPWNLNNSYYDDLKEKRIINTVKKSENKDTICELGAGEGRITNKLAKIFNKIEVIELVESAINRNKIKNKEFKNMEYFNIDIENFEFNKNKYDVVLASEILYYLVDGNKNFFELSLLFKNLVASLKSDGNLIFINTTKVQDVETKKDIIIYYEFIRKAIYQLLKGLGLKIKKNSKFYGEKLNRYQEYEIVVFSK